MNTIILRALFEDARQQVLDNKVFRLLIILTAAPILFTFLVGFQEEQISFLWGWKELSYEDLLRSFGGSTQASTAEINIAVIQGLQSIIVTNLVGSFGMMLCIAATAFFTPRILEKGAADTLFSKPVSRMTILMSRYLAGILFVAFLSCALVLGMYLGFLVTSGYNDPGFLWGALTLVYLYAMMHAFSVAVAVFTRSSTAAILMTLFLFMFCGAVHGGWGALKYSQEQSLIAQLRGGSDDEDSEEKDTGDFVQGLIYSLETMHYVLPKTSDADIITDKLRRALTEEAPVIETEDGDFLLKLGPVPFALVESTQANFETTGVEWIDESHGADTPSKVNARRYKRPEIEKKVGSRTRLRKLTSKDVSRTYMDDIEARTGIKPKPDNRSLSDVRVIMVPWHSDEDNLEHEHYIFHFGEWMYEVDVEESAKLLEDTELKRWKRDFLYRGNIVLGSIAGMRPDAWYREVFDWDARLPYNIFFSIGSSLAFIGAMLGLAWLKLRRIDF